MEVYYLQHYKRKNVLMIIELQFKTLQFIYLKQKKHTKTVKRRKKHLEKLIFKHSLLSREIAYKLLNKRKITHLLKPVQLTLFNQLPLL